MNADDLERDLHERQRRDYQRLQEAAARRLFERQHGRPAESLAEITAGTFSGSVTTVDPARHLAPEDMVRILATATG